MNIVILDGYTLNPGDLTWEGFEKLGTLTVYDRSAPNEVPERAKDADILLTNKTPLGQDIISQLTKTAYIGVLATGYNVVDIDAAKQKGITVTNVPGYGTDSVVQLTFALLLELTLRVQRHSDSVMDGKWARSADFCFWDYPLVELANKTMGIIGFGSIGERIADVATAFGMNIIGSKRHHTDQSHRKNFRWATVPELLAQSDVVTIHSPLTAETKGLINKENLALMKPT
ncbi:NAD(P)-dependent oxidoreductase, partial [Arsenicibacter rosenii]